MCVLEVKAMIFINGELGKGVATVAGDSPLGFRVGPAPAPPRVAARLARAV